MVLLDLLSPAFDKVYCVFMYFVKDMQHMQPYLMHASKYNNTELIQLPHWMTSYYLKHNYYSFARPNDRVKLLRQSNLEKKVRQQTGVNWIVFGHRMADNMNRRVMLSGYKFDAINEKKQKIYPLSHWKKQNIVDFIRLRNLPQPVQYGKKNSQGLDLTEDVLVYLRENHPGDLNKILKIFPLSQTILFEHDYRKRQPA